MGEIVNRVKNSPLKTLDVSDFYDNLERINLDFSNFLNNGILIEKQFREKLKNYDNNIILVTSAFHMPRAKYLFEQEGFKVFPYPVDFKVSERSLTIMDFFPASSGLDKTSMATRELIGRIYYKILSWANILR